MLLEIDGTIIIAGLSFVVFVIIMNIIFYRPVQAIIEKRNALIEDEKRAIADNHSEKDKLIEHKQTEISATNLQSKELMNSITEEYRQNKQKLIEEENAKAKSELEALKSQLDEEVKGAESESAKYVEEISQSIISKVLARGGGNV